MRNTLNKLPKHKFHNTFNVICVLILLIINSQTIYAQSNLYHPFAGHSAKWVTNSSGLSGNCCCSGMCVFEAESKYYICGDTLIDNKIYTKLYSEGRHTTYITGPPVCPPGCYSSSTSFVSLGLMGFITQDTLNKKVFFRYYSSQIDQLLYDFDLHLADTLPVSMVNQTLTNVVTKIDSVQINGSYRKKFWISCDSDTTNTICHNYTGIVEGFGSDMGLFASLIPNFEFSSYGSYTDSTSQVLYLCNTLGNNELYEEKVYTIYPNPVSNKIYFLNAIREIANVTIYNALGEMVMHFQNHNLINGITVETLSSGIYYCKITEIQTGHTSAKKLIIE